MENNKNGLAYTLAGGVIGIGMSTIFPPLLIPSAVVASGSLFLHAYDKIFKSDRGMWVNLGLMTKDEKVPICIKTITTDVGVQRIYHILTGLSVEQVQDKQEEIENALKKNVKIDKTDNFNMVIQTFNKKLGSLYPFKLDYMQKDMVFATGYSQSMQGEKLETINLNSSDCHMLISGTTGSGKSEFLRHLLVQYIIQTKGLIKNGELWIADLKGGVTTKIFSRANNCTHYTIFAGECENMMQELHEIMMKRYIMLNNGNCVDYIEYNKKFKREHMKPIIFVIEEYSLLFNSKVATELLFLLLNLSRAANVSVLLTIQRPDHKTLDTRIKANLRTTVSFKVKSDVDSEIVLGHGNYLASRELKNAPAGRAILNDEKHNDIIFQSLFLKTKEIEELLKEYLTKNPTYSTYQQQVNSKEQKQENKATKEDIKQIDNLI